MNDNGLRRRSGGLVVVSGGIAAAAVWAAVIAAWPAAAMGQGAGTPAASAPAVELGPKHIDVKNGFSIRPPGGTDRQRVTSPTAIVSWASRDAKTSAIEWTLTIQKVAESDKISSLKAYSGVVLDRLRAAEKFVSEDVKLDTVDGKPCFDIRGQFSQKQGIGKDAPTVVSWQRQVWIQQEPQQFLVAVIAGAPAAKDRLDAVLSAVVKTLAFIDQKALAAQREENLKRGKDLLDGLKPAAFAGPDDKVAAAMPKAAQWFIIRLAGKEIGFLCQQEKTLKKGYEGAAWAFSTLGGKTMLTSKLFVPSGNLSDEECSDQLKVGAAADMDEVTKKGDVVSHKTTPADGKGSATVAKAPPDAYLARLVEVLLPRLVDLKKPASYAFMAFNARKDAFDTRTFTVDGPDKLTIDGKQVECVRATYQQTLDSEPAVFYLDAAAGAMLRMSTAEGLTMDAATADAVRKLYAEAKEIGN